MLAELLVKAYENEIALDKKFKKIFVGIQDIQELPNYKVLKQVAIQKKYGLLYWLMVHAYRLSIPLLILAQVIYSFFEVLRKKTKKYHNHSFMVTTTKTNIDLIQSVSQSNSDILGLSIHNLSTQLSYTDYIKCVKEMLKFCKMIVNHKERSDLVLHSHDCFKVLLFAQFVYKNNKCKYISDGHYQRWSFILSTLCNNFSIVQHGFIDPDIEFPNAFGSINTIYIRDKRFAEMFSQYFTCKEYIIYKQVINLSPVPGRVKGIFLASSFPRIDEEIELIQKITALTKLPIIIKLHPSHEYDSNKKAILLSYASYICEKNEVPECSIFISYNSFLEFTYRDLNIFTFSIERDSFDSLVKKLTTQLR